MAREVFHRQLRELQDEMLALGSMVDSAIDQSVIALRDRDMALSNLIIENDKKINRQRFEIEERCLLLINTQAPMASDLRVLAAVLHIATDLERMGDHAAGIAKIAIMLGEEPPLKPLVDVPRMAEVAREMLAASLDAFVRRDAEATQQISLRDDEVDALYNQVYRELLTYMLSDPGTINRATRLLWVAHNLERIADRVTNICERVSFLVTGKMIEVSTGTDRELFHGQGNGRIG